ncbi:MAG: polyprenyl synthetase family protein [Bacteroidia bacterium]|nr:polyprenyl synthetase family protein [Bacteroidia bacterium]
MKNYSELLKIINDKIAVTSYGSNPKNLYDPINYMMELGGKRLRPVLTLMACDLFDTNIVQALDAALAIEVFHNFTLVHDDIMDNAPIRRGKETVYKKWSMPIAILSGDLMLIKAIDLLALTTATPLLPILQVFNKVAANVCEGQQIDMNFEERDDVSFQEYIEMIALKTAVLLGGALKIGALIGGAVKEDADNLYNFGKNIGIAFQIQDDILDSFGEGKQVGKRIGGDIASNKKTLLLIELMEVVHKDDKILLKSILNNANPDNKINEVLKLYEKYQIKQFAEQKKQEYLKTAFEHLKLVQTESERKKILEHTALELMNRMS